MNPLRIFVARKIPEIGIQRLHEHFASAHAFDLDIWQDDRPPTRDIMLTKVQGASGLLTLLSDKVDAEVLDAAGPSLKVVSNFAVGYNNIDVQAANQRRVRVGNTPDVLTDATADMAMCLLLAAARHLSPSIDSVRNGKWHTWEPLGFLGTELTNKTLGIIGAGRIGQAMAKRCGGGWGMKILYSARSPKPEFESKHGATHVGFETLLEQSDFVSIHCDLNPATHHLVNHEAFQKMKPGSILINTARGQVIDQEALANALEKGPLSAAGLDVTDPEPLPPSHPLVSLANCVIAPHIGSATYSARNAMSRIAAENIIAGIDGLPMPAEVTT